MTPDSPPPADEATEFALQGDHITLDALLKATGRVASGGAAKALIAAGRVAVNGEVETRRGRKLRDGDEVCVADGSAPVRVRAGT